MNKLTRSISDTVKGAVDEAKAINPELAEPKPGADPMSRQLRNLGICLAVLLVAGMAVYFFALKPYMKTVDQGNHQVDCANITATGASAPPGC